MNAHLAFAMAILASLIAVLALWLAVTAHRRLDRLQRGSKVDIAGTMKDAVDRALAEDFQGTRFRPFRGRGGL